MAYQQFVQDRRDEYLAAEAQLRAANTVPAAAHPVGTPNRIAADLRARRQRRRARDRYTAAYAAWSVISRRDFARLSVPSIGQRVRYRSEGGYVGEGTLIEHHPDDCNIVVELDNGERRLISAYRLCRYGA